MRTPDRFPLNDGRSIPSVGLGLWRVAENDAARIVRGGVEAGYRSFDTASLYENETGLGRGIKECGLPREQLFITTKVWNTCHGYEKTKRAFDDSMKKLKLEYVDLYLIHWPVAGSELYLETWEAFIALREQGRVRSIGVSNFLPHHVKRLIDVSGVTPAVNQIERHPYFQQPETVADNRKLGILTEAWAPLGRGRPLNDPVVTAIAEKYGKTPAQVVLRWDLERGIAVIPKTMHRDRMGENLDIFDFRLEDDEVAAIDGIKQVFRIGDDPDTFVDKK